MSKLYYENLYIGRDVVNFPLVESIRNKIEFKKEQIVDGELHPGNGLLLAKNKGKFIKVCPCRCEKTWCGYWVVEWGFGCPFACEYCIVQNYQRAGDATLYVNFEDCKKEIEDLRKNIKGSIRLGTGHFGDPMGFEEIYPLNQKIVEWTNNMSDFTVEVKTKSDYISPMLKYKNTKNLTMAYSLNTIESYQKLEHKTSSIENRIIAARDIHNATNCNIAFHFEPIIPINDWKNKYIEIFDLLEKYLNGIEISWISLGTFRFPKGFQEYVELYHPDTGIFAEEFYPCADGKIRYFRPLREGLYSFIRNVIIKRFPNCQTYLCMETPEVWERIVGHKMTPTELFEQMSQRVSEMASRGRKEI